MKLFQLTSFVDQKDLDSLKAAVEDLDVQGIVAKVLQDMLDNVEEIDDELTYSDDTRLHGTFDGEAE